MCVTIIWIHCSQQRAEKCQWHTALNYHHHLFLLSSIRSIEICYKHYKVNPSTFSKVFLNFFSLLVGILESFLGSCQHALSNFSYTDIWILLSVRFVILLKCPHFFCGPKRGSDASHTASPTQLSTSPSHGIPCFNWQGSDARVTVG
jgi:hypothetical protein